MWRIFILLYFSYLILGPHWESRLLKSEKILLVDSFRELFRRSIFISYVSLLFIAWFLYKPSIYSFISALMLSGMATVGFHFKYGYEKPIPMHVILNMFLLYMGRKYMTTQLWITIALVLFYTITHDMLYIK